MNKRKFFNLLISLLMVLSIFVGPINALAQEAPAGTEPATAAPAVASESSTSDNAGGVAAPASPSENQPAANPEAAATSASQAAQLVSTEFLINNNPVVDGAKYGEGKFYIKPTYQIPDSATVKNGDTFVYQVPAQLAVEKTEPKEIKAPNDTTVATLTTDPATNTATITITNEAYYRFMNESRTVSALFTAVWADSVAVDETVTMTLPGAGSYTLTRIVPMEDSTGYFKWGVQDKDDPSMIRWQVLVNRLAAKDVTGVSIADTIPEGQELVGEVTGYYFTEWGKEEGHPALDSAGVKVTDKNHFTVTPENGDLSGRGLYLRYSTKLTSPVDNATKKVFNAIVVKTAKEVHNVEGFAPLTTTEGGASASRSDEVIFKVTKKLDGRALKAGEFQFQLINTADNSVVQTVSNDAQGNVTFAKVKFSQAGDFVYKIKEVNNAVPGVTYDEAELTANVKVVDENGEKKATVTYDQAQFANSYKAAKTSQEIVVKKQLEGRALKADEFEFQLQDAQGKVLQTVKNAQDGTVKFASVEFEQAGTYNYKVVEKAGSDETVTYDTKAVDVVVTVVDNGAGQLEASASYTNQATFVNKAATNLPNSSDPAPAAVDFTVAAKKVLVGRQLKDKEFKFELVDSMGKVLATASNDASGAISLTSSYAQEGTYKLTVREVAGQDSAISYDKTKFNVTVAVMKDANGKLKAEVATEKELVFYNAFNAKNPSLPSTGEMNFIWLALVLALISVVLLLANKPHHVD